jgi:hypothetical protein
MKMRLRLRPRLMLSIGFYVVLISQSGFAENLAGLVTSPEWREPVYVFRGNAFQYTLE